MNHSTQEQALLYITILKREREDAVIESPVEAIEPSSSGQPIAKPHRVSRIVRQMVQLVRPMQTKETV